MGSSFEHFGDLGSNCDKDRSGLEWSGGFGREFASISVRRASNREKDLSGLEWSGGFGRAFSRISATWGCNREKDLSGLRAGQGTLAEYGVLSTVKAVLVRKPVLKQMRSVPLAFLDGVES